MSNKWTLTYLFAFLAGFLMAQTGTAVYSPMPLPVPDYITLGAGNDAKITVTTSDDHQLYSGTNTATGTKTVNGAGLSGAEIEAARFLSQSTLGFNDQMLQNVINGGVNRWIGAQFNVPPTYLTDTINLIYQQALQIWIANGNDPNDYPPRPRDQHMDYTWWQSCVKAPDALRHRVAEALSQILVISINSTLVTYGVGVANYYDALLEHAFGNFEDLLLAISLHPSMGVYLTHINNPKTDTVAMQFPDENFARELMQLFCIGLDELNPDGSPILDTAGNRIPTYDNDDISEFAKVFTGLGYGARLDGAPPFFGMGPYNADFTVPMAMYENWHEPGEKYLLNGHVIQAGQTGMQDIAEAVNHLFNHPNVGPFIGRRLIQRLVKSNPTPGYINSVTQVFNNNGQGVRGDMKAVIKAILLHPEARSCAWINHYEQGRLREPILKKTQFVRYYDVIHPLNNMWNYSNQYLSNTDMHPMRSPSVFNFYQPDFAPNGPVADTGLVAPEFGIYNTRTSIGYANQVYRWIETDRILQTSGVTGNLTAAPDLLILGEYAKDPDAILDHLDIVLTHGQLGASSRAAIKEQLVKFDNSINGLRSKIKLATYLMLISPDFNIAR